MILGYRYKDHHHRHNILLASALAWPGFYTALQKRTRNEQEREGEKLAMMMIMMTMTISKVLEMEWMKRNTLVYFFHTKEGYNLQTDKTEGEKISRGRK